MAEPNRLPLPSHSPAPQRYAELVARARAVPYDFPVGPINRIEPLCPDAEAQQQVARFADATRPILHARVLGLLAGFLELKRRRGSEPERRLYADMDVVGLLDRLLKRRPLAFLTASDAYRLRTGERGAGGFDAIGTQAEAPPLLLEQLLSYDEMQLSALLGVSVRTRFINRGDRGNVGRPGRPGSFEGDGVYVGLVGARFERAGRMEWQHMLVDPDQNRRDQGYGLAPADARGGHAAAELLGLWADFYGQPEGFPLHSDALAGRAGADRFLRLRRSDLFLDAEVYKRRIRMSVEPFLLDAADRAEREGRRAYVHAVGLGLGVWQVDPRQGQLMCDVYAEVLREHERLRELLSDLDFSWFPAGCTVAGLAHGDRWDRLRLHFSRRDPAAPLQRDRLLVAMYAWDSNSYPGNEYWNGSLAASGDPAAACCSLISELQNPDVNLRVAGSCAHSFPRQHPKPNPQQAASRPGRHAG